MIDTKATISEADEPGKFSKRVLLAVCGLSPQIVTETVYALATAKPAFVPTEIYLITTREGARKATDALTDGGAGWLRKLMADYQLPDIAFGPESIHILQTPEGLDIDDIRTLQDNQYAADFITDTVRRHTLDSCCALHVSIAGGRKTMGFYLGYALSLYGRRQDRLSHVLVNAPFENCADFFYPTPYSHIMRLRDQSYLDARDAQVALAQVPFVSLRHGLPQALLDGHVSFNDTVQAIAVSMAPPRLDIDLISCRIRASGMDVELAPAELAFLSMFARRAMSRQPPLHAPAKDVPDPQWAERYLEEYRLIVRQISDIDATQHALRNGMDGGYFSQRKSKLERKLKAALQSASALYLIDSGNRRPRMFSMLLPPQAIRYCHLGVVSDLAEGEKSIA